MNIKLGVTKLDKGFKQFLVKTGLFLVVFVLISFIIGQRIVASSLLMGFKIYIYGGMGKVLLFTIFGFVLLYRDRLLKLKDYKYEKKNIIFLIISLISVISFYILELNIGMFSPSILSIILIHALFLSIFIFLGLGIYSLNFIKDFFNKFKKELGYFLIFGIITYSLMNQVWKLWPYLSLVVTKTTVFLLDIIGNPVLIDEYTIMFNGFAAQIGEACSGVYSMFIFTALYLFAVILDWKKLNKKKVALVFIPAIIGAFLVNIFRVFLLFIVGAFVSEEMAIGLYHSYVGMIFFLIYFSVFWVLFYNWMKKPEYKKSTFLGRLYDKIMGDSLYKNSIYLMLNTLVITGLGFFFWMINTRLFSVEDIGIATALISVMGLITGLSVLGLNTGLIRFLPKAENKNKKINTAFTLVIISSIIVTTIFLMFANTISPKLLFIQENMILSFAFIFFMIVASFNLLIESIFTAYRSTKYILGKNIIFSTLKLVFPFLLVFLGAFGIFSSWMISLFIASIFSLIILIIKFNYRPKFAFHNSIIKRIGGYSFGNYVAGFIGGLPLMILPLLILNKLGAEQVAYYYMAMMIAALLFAIPQATSQSLFAEGSYSEKDLKKQIKKAVKIIAFILIPAILVIVFFGQYLLMLFGKEYATEGFRFLQIIAVSGVFVGVNKTFMGILKVRRMIKSMIFVNGVGSLLIIFSSYIFSIWGLIGIGIGWSIGNVLISFIYFIIFTFWRNY